MKLLTPALVALACLPLSAVAEDERPSWEWTDAEIEAAVNKVRAGRDLNPDHWPGGARVAVLLSFDVDNETVWLRNNDTNVGGLSQGQYGARVALGRILALLDEHSISATFFGPAVSFSLNPGMIEAIQASGRHEIGIHGWIHERNATLPRADEERLLRQAVTRMTELVGKRPVGYRAPSWNFSDNTLDLLMEMGFLYDSSLMADDRPYELVADGKPTGFVELPVDWILDDAPLMNPLGDRYESPRAVLEVYKDEFDVAYEEGTTFVLTMHPHYIGHRSRIVVLRELIEHMKEQSDVWFGTHEEAVRWVRQQAGMD
ncbi:MAG: polysaccharide deacetylase [Gammaproteobacteria bacterium]|nr:polysaccharide deacetylase [Gammaproteobacteria bacterium]